MSKQRCSMAECKRRNGSGSGNVRKQRGPQEWMAARRGFGLKYFIVELVVAAEFLHHLQDLGVGHLILIEIDSLDILFEFNWPVDLDLLVRPNHHRRNFVGLTPIECCLQLSVGQFIQHIVAKLKSTDRGGRAAGVHVGESAAVPDVGFQQEVRLAVAGAGPDSLGVVGEVDGAVLDSLEGGGRVVEPIKHAVLPAGAGSFAEGARRLLGFELVAVVGVLDEELHVVVGVHVDDDRGVVDDVVMQVFEIAGLVPHGFDAFHEVRF